MSPSCLGDFSTACIYWPNIDRVQHESKLHANEHDLFYSLLFLDCKYSLRFAFEKRTTTNQHFFHRIQFSIKLLKKRQQSSFHYYFLVIISFIILTFLLLLMKLIFPVELKSEYIDIIYLKKKGNCNINYFFGVVDEFFLHHHISFINIVFKL